MNKKRELAIVDEIVWYVDQEKRRLSKLTWYRVVTVVLLFVVLAAILIEPFSKLLLLELGKGSMFIYWVVFVLLYFLKGALFLEVLGYLLHRFTEHPSFITRISHHYRQNQQYHWIHHMVMYPFGNGYYEKRSENYIDVVREGLPLYFLLPLSVSALLVFLVMGFTLESAIFIFAALFQTKLNDLTHSRFHFLKHPWVSSRYFQWLADIHLLHHWDQEKNFTIMNPLLDMIFGTYLSPKEKLKDVKKYLADNDLNASELISWNYLLTEARPAKRAVFVAGVRKHPGLIDQAKKIDKFLTKLLKQNGLPKKEVLARKFMRELARRMKVFLKTV